MRNYSGIDEDSRVIELIEQGYSAYKISKMLPYSKYTILKYMDRNNIQKKKCKVDYNNLLKDKKELIITLNRQGRTLQEIGDIIGHAGSSVYRFLNKEGIDTSNTYNVDESFFKKIDSPEKAYILGWFYSDGCVDKSGKFRIQIQEEDSYILNKIKQVIKYDGPLYNIPPPKKYPHRKAQKALCINRKVMADDLINLGCIPNKSLKLIFPGKDKVPTKFLSHFVRGVFDGDGCISLKKKKYLGVCIVSTDDFISSLRKILFDLNIDTKHYYRYDYTNTVQMMITKSKHAGDFCNWIYNQAKDFYLTRKYDKYKEWLSIGV